MPCLKCGRLHLPIWQCDTEARKAFLLNSFGVNSDAATAAETLNIHRYDKWRDNGRQTVPTRHP
jgi:hypothetical protein